MGMCGWGCGGIDEWRGVFGGLVLVVGRVGGDVARCVALRCVLVGFWRTGSGQWLMGCDV